MQSIIKNLSELEWADSSHIGVQKKVFFSDNAFSSNITQVAYSELEKGAEVVSHIHETMEEVFYLLDGVCEFNIKGVTILADKNSLVRIPTNSEHSLLAISYCKFIYFGVSI